MFTATTFYRICIALVGAVSVRGDCLFTPDENGRVVISEGTKSIPEEAFKDCAALEKVVIPASVENIEFGAFLGSGLKKVFFKKGSNLKGIGEFSFSGCSNLKKINFPASLNLKRIGSYAFSYSGLKKLIFKNESRIKVIGVGAFFECKELKVVRLPASVTEIGADAFRTSGLEKVMFRQGSNLKTIGDSAFEGNENLDTINIPPGVVIDEGAFEVTGCRADIFTPGATIVDCNVN